MKSQNNFYNKKQKQILGDVAELPRVHTSTSPTQMPAIHTGKQPTSPQNPSGNSFSILASYNLQNINIMDIDKLKEELIKVKTEYNKKHKEYNSLKVSYLKLDAENKNYVRIIEEIIEEANKKKSTTGEKEETDIQQIIANGNFDAGHVTRLKDAHALNNLKRHLEEYKRMFTELQEELTILRQNSKVAKLQELENKLANTTEELKIVVAKYNALKTAFNDKDIKSREAFEERDYYKNMTSRIKNQYEETREKLNSVMEKYSKLDKINLSLEEKNNSSKFQNNSIKSQIREKDNEIAYLKEQIESLENFKNEKEKYEKNTMANEKTIKSLKDENEKKKKKIKEIEKSNMDYIVRIEELEKEKLMLLARTKEPASTNKEKDNKIKQLEQDNTSIKSQLVAGKTELNKLKIELTELNANYKQLREENDELQDKYEEILDKYVDMEKEAEELKKRKKEENNKGDKAIIEARENITTEKQVLTDNKEKTYPLEDNPKKEVKNKEHHLSQQNETVDGVPQVKEAMQDDHKEIIET